MSEQCPSCGGSLEYVDVNPELANKGTGKSGLYEYRHIPPVGHCSIAVIPGVTHIRCFGCFKFIPGRKGFLICLDCIDAGLDYKKFDLRREDH